MVERRVEKLIVLLGALAASACAAPRGPADVEVRYGPQRPAPVSYAGVDGPAQCRPSYRVRRGDTLSAVSEICGVSQRELAAENGLRPPYHLQAGQTLVMPRPSTHVVRRGENLYRIALGYGMTTGELAGMNGLSAPYTIYPGQELTVDGSYRVASASSTPPPPRPAAPASSAPPPTASTAPAVQVETAPPSRPAPQPRPQPVSNPTAPAASAQGFTWPLDGEVIEPFGPRADGGRNDGMKIAATIGDPVRAAAPGTVMYAGDGLESFGNLILIRHSGGYVTAYGHNSVLRVAENAEVAAGDVIAEAGQTGSADRPMLHFEVRHEMSPVDPTGVLPAR